VSILSSTPNSLCLFPLWAAASSLHTFCHCDLQSVLSTVRTRGVEVLPYLSLDHLKSHSVTAVALKTAASLIWLLVQSVSPELLLWGPTALFHSCFYSPLMSHMNFFRPPQCPNKWRETPTGSPIWIY
jgi:hypothetical protein